MASEEVNLKKLIGREMATMANYCLSGWASNRDREELTAEELTERILDRYVRSAGYLSELLKVRNLTWK